MFINIYSLSLSEKEKSKSMHLLDARNSENSYLTSETKECIMLFVTEIKVCIALFVTSLSY